MRTANHADVRMVNQKFQNSAKLIYFNFGPSDDDQAVSLSDDGTTIIIDFFSFSAITVLPERVVVGFPNFAWAPKKK